MTKETLQRRQEQNFSIFCEQARDLDASRPTRALLESLFRHLRLFIVIFAIVLVGTLAATLLTKKQYQSEMKILLENNRSNAVITPDRNTTNSVPQITEPELNSELEILSSDDVVAAVADPGWAQLKRQERVGERLKVHGESLRGFRKHLKIEPARKSNIITVAFTAPSPDEATRTLAAFADAYMAQRKLLSRPAGTAAFFAEQASHYQTLWQQASDALTAFQRNHQLVSVPQREEQLSRTLAGDEEDLRTNQVELSAIEGRLKAAHAAAQSIPQRHQTVARVQTGQASSEQLRALLVQLENRRTELMNRYQPTDTLVREVDKQIGATAKSLNELLTQQGKEETTDINPPWQQVESSMVTDQLEHVALRAKSSKLAENIAALRTELKGVESLEGEFNTLEESADQARSNFEFYSEKRDQAQAEDAMDERKIVNVGIAESPTSPYRPSSPRLGLNATLGLLAALFLAFGATYLAESSRNTFATPQELESYTQYPVLATIPVENYLIEKTPRNRFSKRLSILSAEAPVPARMAAISPLDSPNTV